MLSPYLAKLCFCIVIAKAQKAVLGNTSSRLKIPELNTGGEVKVSHSGSEQRHPQVSPQQFGLASLASEAECVRHA